MKISSTIILIFLSLAATFLLCACESNAESKKAQNRPAKNTKEIRKQPWVQTQNWEGGPQGMSSGTMPKQY